VLQAKAFATQPQQINNNNTNKTQLVTRLQSINLENDESQAWTNVYLKLN